MSTASAPLASAYTDLHPAEIWRHFSALNGIPRPSGHEAAARDYVKRIAAECGAEAVQDAKGNCVVRAAGSPGREGAPCVALQSHLDMVCEQRPEISQDFFVDPIRPRRDGDWIFATGTTLGADNGLGAAMMLATLTDASLVHGPLELLFTVEEETGLFGAAEMDSALLSATMLLNLDSEDPDEITVGCAGGVGANLSWRAPKVPTGTEAPLQLKISGLAGGHSGMQIHEPLGNAMKIAAELLHAIADGTPLSLVSINGGNAHNAIPRDATALLYVRDGAAARNAFEACRVALLERWHPTEPFLAIELDEASAAVGAPEVWTVEASGSLLELLRELPHGVLQMSKVFEGKVETSANLAVVRTTGDSVEIHVSVRSFRDGEMHRVLDEVTAKTTRFGATYEIRDGYPGWEPQSDSELLYRARQAFAHTQGHEPVVHVVHAGLECGLLVRKKPGLEAVSFGPHIRGAHTPEECVQISSVAASWSLLAHLLGDLSTQL